MHITTTRLEIKELTANDSDLLYSVYSSENIMRYAYNDRYENRESFDKYFETVIANNDKKDNRREYQFIVHDKSSGEFIGAADIEIYKKNEHGGFGEIGYFLLEKHWGNGYASEITGALIETCFCELGLHKVTASCNVHNAKSENVMKKNGMKLEGRFRKERFKDGRWDDELHYCILKEEWEERI